MKACLKFLIYLILFSSINILPQPYIFRVEFEEDSTNDFPPYSLTKINLKNNQLEPFVNLDKSFHNYYTEPTNKWIIIVYKFCDESKVINIDDTAEIFIFNNTISPSIICFGGGLTYSEVNKKIYFFEPQENTFRLTSLNIQNGEIEELIDIKPIIDENYGFRDVFLSLDEQLLYFLAPDTLYADTIYNQDKIYYFSTINNSLIRERKISNLGLNGSDAYSIIKGRYGKTIIGSIFYYPSPSQYYRLYDLDNDTGYAFINQPSWVDPYIIGYGDYILFAYDTLLNSREVIHRGNFSIYNSNTGQLVKTLTLPPGGTIYTFDNYPNDIYYVLNLDTQPEIYNLTKLELHQISPAIALISPFGSQQEFNFNITAYGGLFTDSSIAYFNGQANPTSKINDTTVVFTLSNSDISSTGNYPLWISNYGSDSDTLNFSVTTSLPNSVTPTFQCVRRNPDKSYTAYFGYNNNNSSAVFIPTGSNNRFSPSPDFRGQPNIFLSGNHQNVFTVNFNGDNLTWYLAGQSITINKNSTACP